MRASGMLKMVFLVVAFFVLPGWRCCPKTQPNGAQCTRGCQCQNSCIDGRCCIEDRTVACASDDDCCTGLECNTGRCLPPPCPQGYCSYGSLRGDCVPCTTPGNVDILPPGNCHLCQPCYAADPGRIWSLYRAGYSPCFGADVYGYYCCGVQSIWAPDLEQALTCLKAHCPDRCFEVSFVTWFNDNVGPNCGSCPASRGCGGAGKSWAGSGPSFGVTPEVSPMSPRLDGSRAPVLLLGDGSSE